MKRNIITIPNEFTYLSEVTHYKMNGKLIDKPLELFKGIFNKVYTNCGGTTLVLKDNIPSIICCPRKGMLISKHLLMANNDNYTTCLVIGNDVIQDNTVIYKKQTKDDIKKYINSTDVPKILVTYDSLYKVIECIPDIERWHIVIDEFQLCLFDSGIKSEIEQRLFTLVKNLNTTFLSATPLNNDVLLFIDEVFKDIEYYECEFENKERFEKINIQRIECKSPISGIELLLTEWYINGNYYEIDGIKSKECVVFLNSVKNIVKIVSELNLKPQLVNIICSDTDENLKLILTNLGNEFNIGYVPTNTNNKMFTFCTSTAYCGTDFYSYNAAIFIVSDTTQPNTTIDIEYELQQIIGRERLDNNPFKYVPFLIYNSKKKRSELFIDEYTQDINKRTRITNDELIRLNSITDNEIREYEIKKIKQLQRTTNYSISYTSYCEISGKFIFNKCYKLNELYKLQQLSESYNGIYIYKTINNTNTMYTENKHYTINSDIVINVKKIVNTRNTFEEYMKRYCDYKDNNTFDITIDNVLNKYPQIKDYYELLGSKKIKSLSYKEKNLKNEIINIHNNGNKESAIINSISQISGILLSNDEIKNNIQEIYNKYNIMDKGKIKKAKATDVKQYGFSITKKNVRIDGKQTTKYIIEYDI